MEEKLRHGAARPYVLRTRTAWSITVSLSVLGGWVMITPALQNHNPILNLGMVMMPSTLYTLIATLERWREKKTMDGDKMLDLGFALVVLGTAFLWYEKNILTSFLALVFYGFGAAAYHIIKKQLMAAARSYLER